MNAEIDNVVQSFQKHKTDFIITTEKDAVRLEGFLNEFHSLPLVALQMQALIHEEDEWKKFIKKN